jgi:predicted ATPase
MRQYVPVKDIDLRRDARNLSAVLAHMKARAEKGTWEKLTRVIQALPEHPIAGIEFDSTGFGDVMAGIRESFNERDEVIPAKQMSDGMLRMLAISTSVLGGASSLAIAPSLSGVTSTPTVLIEELENGLHPSQAHALLELIIESIKTGDQQLIVTTHSPALLNALSGDQHRGVLVVSRDPETGWSSVDRLVDLPGYSRALASDSLGTLVEKGRLGEAYKSPHISRQGVQDLLRMI